MSFLNTTASLHHRTLLPPGTTTEQAILVFHNHDVVIRLDPHLSHYEEEPAPLNANPKTKLYKVMDVLETLPAGLWSSTIAFTAELTDTEKGVTWVIKAPLGLLQTTVWTVVPAEEKDLIGLEGPERENRLVFAQDVEIKCSRLIIGTVKSRCEDDWSGVHKRYTEQLGKVVA